MGGRARGGSVTNANGRSAANANNALAQTPTSRFSGGEIIAVQNQPHESMINHLNNSRVTDPAVDHISNSSPLLYQSAGLQRTGLSTFVETRRAPSVNHAVYAGEQHEENLRRRMPLRDTQQSPHTSDTVPEQPAEQFNNEDNEAAQNDRRHVLPSLHATDRVFSYFFLIHVHIHLRF